MQILFRGWAVRRFLLSLLLLAATASIADAELGGFMEFSNTISSSKSVLGGDTTDNVRANNFTQRYNLSLNQSLYPQLRLSAGGMFERADSDSTSNGLDTNSTATQLSPYIGLTLGGGPATASTNYSRNETTSSSSGGLGGVTEIFENYNGRITLRPEGLPSLSLLVSRANSFDEDKVDRDNTSDFYSLSSRYQPNPNTTFNYSGSMTESINRLSGQETSSFTNSLRGDYARPFYNKRGTFVASGTVGNQMNETTGVGDGLVEILPVGGYFAINDTATFVPLSLWTPVPQLTGGSRNLPATVPSPSPVSSINLGPTPPNGDSGPRQMGFDFGAAPDLARRGVNTVYVYVPLQDGLALPPTVTGRFTWDVYSSRDNQNWSAVATGVLAGFEAFNDPQLSAGQVSALPNVSRFVISFPTVPINDPDAASGTRIQYLKVVVRPLPTGTATPDPRFDLTKIVVNKIEAFFQGSIEAQKTSSVSTLLETGVRMRIYESARSAAMYDLNMNYNQSIPDQGASIYSYFLSSGISGNHRFNSFITGTGRVGAEQAGQKGNSPRNAYTYSASLQAVPLSTLRHVLVFSGRFATSDEGNSNSSALFLSNTAQLYQGVGASLTGGVSESKNEDDSQTNSTFLNLGVNLVPHRTVNVNMAYAETRSHASGGDRAEGSNSNRSAELSASYSPISALFFFGSISYSGQSQREGVVSQSFGGNWSPFRDGALQLNTAYSESLSSAADESTSTLSVSLRYNIRPGWWLDSSYGLQKTESGETLKHEDRVESLSTSLRLNF